MLATTVCVVAGALIAAEAGTPERTTFTICFDQGTPLVTWAFNGCWLTLGAMVMVAGFHLLRTKTMRGWIAERRLAWTLRHAASRPRPRHPAHHP